MRSRVVSMWNAAIVLLSCALLLAACAGVNGDYPEQVAMGDYWDTRLSFMQQIDVATLVDADSGRPAALSGFVSALAARGDDLYFIDAGAGKLVHVSLAAMTARTMVALRSATARGLYASRDGSVYVIDNYNRQVLRLDPSLGELDRYSLGHISGNPVDLTLIEGDRSLLVLDALDGRIAVLDLLGGLQQLIEPQYVDVTTVSSATAIDTSNGEIFLLDSGVDAVAGINLEGYAKGDYGGDDLQHVSAFAVDDCGRMFIADAYDGGLYVGVADMSLPGRRVKVPELDGKEIGDLWSDESFLYVATLADGIIALAVGPECML
ncbi:MAG: hypothetical protein OEU53_05540 [Gammaproteobacteria bacterium]|nr:hypothetical protein [Gammaproteobacteria bacterium]